MIERLFDKNSIGKKWTLLGISIIGIIATLTIAVVAIVVVENIDGGQIGQDHPAYQTTLAAKV